MAGKSPVCKIARVLIAILRVHVSMDGACKVWYKYKSRLEVKDESEILKNSICYSNLLPFI
jgi:hypothetical protein